MMNNIFALLAAFFMGISHPTGLYELLIIGRFLTGINAGTYSDKYKKKCKHSRNCSKTLKEKFC